MLSPRCLTATHPNSSLPASRVSSTPPEFLKQRSLPLAHRQSSYRKRRVKSKIPKLRYMPRFHALNIWISNNLAKNTSDRGSVQQALQVASQKHQQICEDAKRELSMHRQGNSTFVAQACPRRSGKRPASPLGTSLQPWTGDTITAGGIRNAGLVEGRSAEYSAETGEGDHPRSRLLGL